MSLTMKPALARPAHGGGRPPAEQGLGRGFAFALLAHGLLVLGLVSGLQWRTATPPAFEAELWATVPVAAAPREQAPPEPEPEPESPPKPTPPQPQPKVPNQQELQQQREAEIAIVKAREAKLKAEQDRLAAERLKKQEQARRAEEQAKREQDKQRRDEQARELAKKKAEAQDAARREALRQENLRRIQGMAGASGAPTATGTALQSAGPSASYAGRIKARIRPNIIFAEKPGSNPRAEVEVRTLPDGRILSSRLLKPSGDLEWDRAVLRAIDKTEILPRDTDGRVPALLVIAFQPLE